VAYTLMENREMQHMCKKLGFHVHPSMEDAECSIVMDLPPESPVKTAQRSK
jgi:hypothetical protein